jgi:hypothetical protein
LACLVSKEPLTGYICPKTGQEVEASRQTTLEELPPILILHLKCFVYDKSGGCQKLMKRVDFSSDLELSKGIQNIKCFIYIYISTISFHVKTSCHQARKVNSKKNSDSTSYLQVSVCVLFLCIFMHCVNKFCEL